MDSTLTGNYEVPQRLSKESTPQAIPDGVEVSRGHRDGSSYNIPGMGIWRFGRQEGWHNMRCAFKPLYEVVKKQPPTPTLGSPLNISGR